MVIGSRLVSTEREKITSSLAAEHSTHVEEPRAICLGKDKLCMDGVYFPALRFRTSIYSIPYAYYSTAYCNTVGYITVQHGSQVCKVQYRTVPYSPIQYSRVVTLDGGGSGGFRLSLKQAPIVGFPIRWYLLYSGHRAADTR